MPNRVWLILQIAANSRMWRVRQAASAAALRVTEFAIIRLALIRAAAPIIESAGRVRITLASGARTPPSSAMPSYRGAPPVRSRRGHAAIQTLTQPRQTLQNCIAPVTTEDGASRTRTTSNEAVAAPISGSMNRTGNIVLTANFTSL
jgi:hypothetical protein